MRGRGPPSLRQALTKEPSEGRLLVRAEKQVLFRKVKAVMHLAPDAGFPDISFSVLPDQPKP